MTANRYTAKKDPLLSPEYEKYKSKAVEIVTTIDMNETVYGDFDY